MIYDQPVGTSQDRAMLVWAGGWFDATGYAALYTDSSGKQAYHTGADLNLNIPTYDSDRGRPVYAASDGVIAWAGALNVWGGVIIIKHADGIFTRYAHIDATQVSVVKGQAVTRGQQIANVGKPAPSGAPYHLHFDVSSKDLGASPGDWPGMDLARLKRDYLDPKIFINERRQMPRGSPRVQYGRSYNAIHASMTLDQAIDVLKQAYLNKETLGWSYDDAGVGDLDSRTARLYNIPSTDQAAFRNFYNTYYPGVVVQFLSIGPTPPPVPSPGTWAVPSLHAKYVLGVHGLTDSESIWDALALGCRTIECMDNFGTASQVHGRYSEAALFVRRYKPGKLTPAQMIDQLGPSPEHGANCKGEGFYGYTFSNEGDQEGYGSAEQIRAQFAWDKECANLLWSKAPSAKAILATFAHGNPNWQDASIMKAYNETYVPFLIANKSRARVDTHSYTYGRRRPTHPPSSAPIIDPVWFETRNQIPHAGFSAARPEVGISGGQMPNDIWDVSTESGVEAGAGGFAWAGYTPAQLQEWATDYVRLQRASISPISYGAIFQASNRNDWAGYNIWPLMRDGLAPLWVNNVPLTRELPAIVEYDPPPTGYHPPRKVINGN